MFLYKSKKESDIEPEFHKASSESLQKKRKQPKEVRYTLAKEELSEPKIVQAKSMRNLRQELVSLQITEEDILSYASQYDALENTDQTKSDQMKFLQLLFENLFHRTQYKYRQALKLVNTEIYFVLNQNMSIPFERPLLWPQMSHHKNSHYVFPKIRQYDDLAVKNTPFAVNLLKKIRDFMVVYEGKEIRLEERTRQMVDTEIKTIEDYMAAVPPTTADAQQVHDPYGTLDKGLYWGILEHFQPDLAGMSARGKIKALSEKHLQFLDEFCGEIFASAADKAYVERAFYEIKEKVITLIKRDGILAHYSHSSYLTTLESNDHLRESGMLQAPLDSVQSASGDTFGADKSQNFDKKGIGNTGFVFCFLEEREAALRPSRFGNNRYTYMFNGDVSILNDAWAIMNDLADTKYNPHPYIFSTDRINRRVSRDVVTENPRWMLEPPFSDMFDPLSEEYDYLILNTSLLNFQNILKRQTVFFTQDQITSFKDQEIGSNFLYGQQIIEGIAARTAAELIFSHIQLDAVIEQFKTDERALWDYIRQVVFKMQIMVPTQVIPDFIRNDEEELDEIIKPDPFFYDAVLSVTKGPEAGAGLQITMANPMQYHSVGGNNNFFACVKSIVAPEQSPEQLREEFQRKEGVELKDGEPVTLDHVKQFAELYGIQIKLIINVQGGNPVHVVYNEGKSPSCMIALFLPRLRHEGDNPVGLFVETE